MKNGNFWVCPLNSLRFPANAGVSETRGCRWGTRVTGRAGVFGAFGAYVSRRRPRGWMCLPRNGENGAVFLEPFSGADGNCCHFPFSSHLQVEFCVPLLFAAATLLSGAGWGGGWQRGGASSHCHSAYGFQGHCYTDYEARTRSYYVKLPRAHSVGGSVLTLRLS